MEHTLDELLAAAKQIVTEAGAEARRTLQQSKVRRQKAHGDLVTDGDLLVEERVGSFLRARFPGHGFDSEERVPEDPQAEYVWILDPIDGTKYYAKDVPLYSVSLGLRRRGELILGVVFMPEMDRLYCAANGMGATLNGRRIRCSREDQLQRASVCAEIPSADSPRDEQQEALRRMSVLVERSYRVRVIGVASVGLCFCAAGGFDAYVNLGSYWKDCDNAAGQVIVREAGGQFVLVGQHIVAGPQALCATVREALGL